MGHLELRVDAREKNLGQVEVVIPAQALLEGRARVFTVLESDVRVRIAGASGGRLIRIRPSGGR
jgi:hypothetical protein